MLAAQWFNSHRGLLIHAALIVSMAAILFVLLRLTGRRLIDNSSGRSSALRAAIDHLAHSPALALIMLCAA